MRKTILLLGSLAVLFSCTQLIEEDALTDNAYQGDDGCVYCHTNSERLKALAKAEEAGGGDGG
ncbi:MAG TPA: hypothetical protein PKV71_00200 [Calditrichia bacterium]|nr:hypothetical protein [Calditrichota bacterium]HQU72012.1 hypothetical protein [Calditrichia bacterium]HQV30259.1 hypothetical protein [Calditrichia bacterium]